MNPGLLRSCRTAYRKSCLRTPIHSARDISDGGIAVALAEACFSHGIGLRANISKAPDLPAEWDLFGETASQCVISCDRKSLTQVERLVGQYPGLMVATLGETVTDFFELAVDSRVLIRERVSGLRNVWSGALAARCGFKDQRALLGKTAERVFPSRFGRIYTEQDKAIVAGDSKLIDQLELHLYPGSQPGWCMTCKLPLHDAQGKTFRRVPCP